MSVTWDCLGGGCGGRVHLRVSVGRGVGGLGVGEARP